MVYSKQRYKEVSGMKLTGEEQQLIRLWRYGSPAVKERLEAALWQAVDDEIDIQAARWQIFHNTGIKLPTDAKNERTGQI